MPEKVDTLLKAEVRETVRQRFAALYNDSGYDTQDAYFFNQGPTKSTYYRFVVNRKPVLQETARIVLSTLKFEENEIDSMLTAFVGNTTSHTNLSPELKQIQASEMPITVTTVNPMLRVHISNIEGQSLTDLVRGREQDIEWLENLFFPRDIFTEGKKAALTGVGGMGKTTAALEYARLQANPTVSFACLTRERT